MKLAVLLLATLLIAGCQPAQDSARDSLAVSAEAIDIAQEKYLETCTADQTQRVCRLINDAVAAQNLGVEALNLYCAGGDYLTGGVCQPNKEYLPRLQEAIRNLDSIIANIKELLR